MVHRDSPRWVRELNLNGDYKRTSWFYENYKKFYVEDEYAIAFANQIDEIITILDDLYGREKWDFDFRYSSVERLHLHIVISYGDLNIQDSLGNEHLIQDLYLSYRLKTYIILNEDESKELSICLPDNPYAYRGKLTYVEHRKNYLHSHVSRGSVVGKVYPKEGCYFCVGANEYALGVAKAKSEPFNKEDFMFSLILMEQSLNWESADGGPYQEITSLTSQNPTPIFINSLVDTTYSFSQLKRDKRELIQLIQKEKLNINFSEITQTFKVNNNKKFSNKINYLARENNLNTLLFYVSKTYTIRYSTILDNLQLLNSIANQNDDSANIVTQIQINEPLIFNGQSIIREVQNLDNSEETKDLVRKLLNINNFEVTSEITEDIANKLTRGINYAQRKINYKQFVK